MKPFIVNFNIILCILTWKITCFDFKSFLFWLDYFYDLTWLSQPYDLTQLTWLADESDLTCRWKWLDLAWLGHSSEIVVYPLKAKHIYTKSVCNEVCLHHIDQKCFHAAYFSHLISSITNPLIWPSIPHPICYCVNDHFTSIIRDARWWTG